MTDKYYVNNADIPTGTTSIDVTIGSVETTKVPADAVRTKGISAQSPYLTLRAGDLSSDRPPATVL
jgi:hypothetical protein